jgi:hypothetical protein
LILITRCEKRSKNFFKKSIFGTPVPTLLIENYWVPANDPCLKRAGAGMWGSPLRYERTQQQKFGIDGGLKWGKIW